MVDKISLNIVVASLNLEHNFLIPVDMSVDNAITLIVETLIDEYPGVNRSPMRGNKLIQSTTGQVLNPSCNFKQLSIIQGEKLLLI